MGPPGTLDPRQVTCWPNLDPGEARGSGWWPSLLGAPRSGRGKWISRAGVARGQAPGRGSPRVMGIRETLGTGS